MTTLRSFWRNLPIARKMVGLTTLLVLLTILTLTGLTVRRERINYQSELIAQAELFLETIPITMRDELYFVERDELQEVVDLVGDTQSISQIMIYDPQGQLIVSSEQETPVYSQWIDPLGQTLIERAFSEPYFEWQDNDLLVGQAIVVENQVFGAVATIFSTETLDAKIADLTRQSILLALGTLLLGILLTVLLTRQITNPLRQLTELATQMAAGRLDIRADYRARDELGQLAQVFNQMATAIQKRETELRELTLDLERTVAERTAELRQQNAILENIAVTDTLTQCYNRRFFFDLAEKELHRSERSGLPLSIVIIDIDHFKRVNDTYGHLVGDQVLIRFVDLCRENIRSVDIFARYGGEEFIILMPDAICSAARLAMERLRQLLDQTRLLPECPELQISISVGVACWHGSLGETIDGLVARADQALYHSKQNGRNRVSVWSELGLE